MVKIRPNAKPIPPWKPSDGDTKKSKGKKPKSPHENAADLAKTAAAVTKSQTSRLTKLVQSGASAAGTAAGAAGACAGVGAAGGAAAAGVSAAAAGAGAAAATAGAATGAAAGTPGGAVAAGIKAAVGTAAGVSMQINTLMAEKLGERASDFGALAEKVAQFEGLQAGVNWLNDSFRASKNEPADFLREYRSFVQENIGDKLLASTNPDSPVSRLHDAIEKLDFGAGEEVLREKFSEIERKAGEASESLGDLNQQLTHRLQIAATESTQAENVASSVFQKFSDSADRIIGNI